MTRFMGLALIAHLTCPTLSSAEAFPDSTRTETYRPRLTRTGATIGAATGAAAGGLWFFLIAAFADAEGEDITALGYAGLTRLGVLLGGTAGLATGALVGSALYGPERPVANGSLDSAPGRRTSTLRGTPIGLFTLQTAWVGFSSRNDAREGIWLQASYESQAIPWLTLGPELAVLTGEPSATRLAGVVHIQPFHGFVSPYAVSSLGANFWPEDLTLLGASAGAGVRVGPPDQSPSFFIEARHHWNLQNAVEPGSYRFETLGGGLRLTW